MPAQLEREASKLFSTAMFRPLALGESSKLVDARTGWLRSALGLRGDSANFDVVAAAYRQIVTKYRTEYFYKNLIADKLLIGRHRASKAALLNEFRIGDSIADCILLDNRATVYEIKTEFDSPGKLRSQLQNYYRAFAYVNVVTTRSNTDRYLKLLAATPAGLITVGPRGALSTAKTAEEYNGSLEIRTMLNSLRQQEVEAALNLHFGHIPRVANGIRYEYQLNLARQIDPLTFREYLHNSLRARKIRHSREFLMTTMVAPLRAVISQLDPNLLQQKRLSDWLKDRGA